MKKRTKAIIGLAVASLGCFAMAACTSTRSPYEGFDENGYSVTVRFDANGGLFASTQGVSIVDVYSYDSAVKGTKLVEPGAAERGDGNKTLSTVSRSDYFLAGWYKTKEKRVDANGNALDEDGNLCSVSGKPQGDSFSDRWDFATNKFTVGSDFTYEEGKDALVLYAAWIPYFSYNFYMQSDSNAWVKYESFAFNPITEATQKELPLPSLDEDGVAYRYGSFLQAKDKTFVACYEDEGKTQQCEEKFVHKGVIDYEHGVANGVITNCYATWREGVWFNIFTAEQFLRYAQTNGCYNVMADLDFTDLGWSAGLVRGEFTGQILGNNHTLSNIEAFQDGNDRDIPSGGLFGFIRDSAVIKDVTFENITYTVTVGSRFAVGASFGLFAGTLSTKAQVSNVTVSGKLLLGPLIPPQNGYSIYNIGLVSGNGTQTGITYSVTVGYAEELFYTDPEFSFTVQEVTGTVTLAAATAQ